MCPPFLFWILGLFIVARRLKGGQLLFLRRHIHRRVLPWAWSSTPSCQMGLPLPRMPVTPDAIVLGIIPVFGFVQIIVFVLLFQPFIH